MKKEISLLKITENRILSYAKETVENRALPDFRDGLKPVQRRILWAMHGLQMKSSGSPKKSARVTGETLGKYHPHSDMSCYSAMVNMANQTQPLIQGEGNWGDNENPAAAQRYTECRLSKYSESFLLDPEYLEVGVLVPNYDGEFVEPLYLPSKIPNLLINGTEGIATGCSCLIPSFSIKSVRILTKLGLKGRKITPLLCKNILKFEFPYGGDNNNEDSELLSYFKKGEATLYFIPSYTKDDNITLTSLAPRFKFSNKKEKILIIKGVRDIRNRSEGDKICFDIILNKGLVGKEKEAVVKKIESVITNHLPCQTIVTVRHKEKVDFERTNIPDFMNKWIEYRIDLEKKVVENLIKKEKRKKSIQENLNLAVVHRKIIMKSLDSNNPEKFLIKELGIKKEVAQFILDLKVKRLAKLELVEIKKKINSHKKEIKSLGSDLKNLRGRIISQF